MWENSISEDIFTARARLPGTIELSPRTPVILGTHSFRDDGFTCKARPLPLATRPRQGGPGISHPGTRNLMPTHSERWVGQQWAEAQQCCLSRAPGSPLLGLGSNGRRPGSGGATPQTPCRKTKVPAGRKDCTGAPPSSASANHREAAAIRQSDVAVPRAGSLPSGAAALPAGEVFP